MLRSLFITGIYMAFLGLGLGAPFIISLGYVWVDTFRPQDVSYVILNQLPVAMIMGGAAIGSYFVMDRRHPPPLNGLSILHASMAVWITITMVWAVAGDFAWAKWDWAFKTVVFSAFIPLVIRSRVQIEAFVQVYLLSLAANFVPYGLKVLISGGGYGRNLGLLSGNTGLAEGGLLSTACLMAVPLALFLANNTQLVPRWRITPLAYWGIALLAVLTAIGTYQRSALIGLLAMAAVLAVRSRHKMLFIVAGILVTAVLAYVTSDTWTERISSITAYKSDSSAQVRLLVWKWTLGFVTSYPLGGGFNAYIINQISVPGDSLNPGGVIQFARAFHSIYFEVLGEQGWPGLFLFLAICGVVLMSTHNISRRAAKIPELEWCASFAVAIQAGMVAFMSAGAFVGVAFQPMFWYFVAMTVCLRSYLARVEAAGRTTQTGWRAVAQNNLTVGSDGITKGGWRPPVTAKTPTRDPRGRRGTSSA